MKMRKGWLLVGLATWFVGAGCEGTECGYYRIGCLENAAAENLAISLGECGQIFLEFDTVEGKTYVIEVSDSLSPAAWTVVWSLTGDGQRATWLTTSRQWSRTFGGLSSDVASSVQQTTDGGYIVAGSTGSFGAEWVDVYLIKTDADGNEVWSKTFGGTGEEKAYSVQQTTDGGYVLVGWTYSFGAGSLDVYLIKTDANGKEVWSRTLGGTGADWAHSVQQTSDGGYIVAGYTDSFSMLEFDWDIYLIKADAQGNEVWGKTFGGFSRDHGYSVEQTSDGGYIVAGDTGSFGAGDRDVYLIKTDANGDEAWSRTFGGPDCDEAWSVQQTSDGGYIVAGYTDSFGAGDFDFYLIKTDSDGKEVWSKTFGGTEGDGAVSVEQTTDGGYIAAGCTGSFGAGDADVYLIKTDADGNELWSKTFGGHLCDGAECVQQTSDGGYIVAGYTWLFGAGAQDVYLIKTDPNGNAPPLE